MIGILYWFSALDFCIPVVYKKILLPYILYIIPDFMVETDQEWAFFLAYFIILMTLG